MFGRPTSKFAADTLLRSVRTSTVQSWLNSIAAQDKTKSGTPFRRETLKRIKPALSGMFKYAKQQDYFEGVNPVVDSQVPRAPASQLTHAYSLAEINRISSDSG